MSAYNGRRAPNVSQYLANLNAIPSAQDAAQEELSIGDDGLDFLTNTQFFDFDEFNGGANNPNFEQAAQPAIAHGENGQPFAFSEYQNFHAGVASSSGVPSPQSAALQGHYPPQAAHFATSPTSGEKRKFSTALPSPGDLEEDSRLAAEEDKRRRNTAASARFRVKKKQREQALEKAAKDMSEKVQMLEGKVQQLEMENKWLKELITEKSDIKPVDGAEKKKSAEAGERISSGHTDGVGTDKSVKADA